MSNNQLYSGTIKEYVDNALDEYTVSNEIHSGNSIISKVGDACSSLLMTFAATATDAAGSYIGSGSFISLEPSDLVKGLFLTCAHNVIRSSGDSVQFASNIYIENPINNTWINVSSNQVFVDGVGDIALIVTNIDFTQSDISPLKFASTEAKTGQTCYVVGDPAGMDSDSISRGIIRSSCYSMKPIAYQINEGIHIDCSTIGGSSGSPILNPNGEIIGILTYGATDYSTFGGGPNLNSILPSLTILLQGQHNKQKKYLGMEWGVAYPPYLFSLKSLNPQLETTTKGLRIYQVDSLSPFYGIIAVGDIILSGTLFDSNGVEICAYDFGVHDKEHSLGAIIYHYSASTISIVYISGQTGQVSNTNIPLTKTYADVPEIKDVNLQTGLNNPIAI